MVNKVNEIVKYDKIYPNVTMESEWDILAEIRTTMRELASSRPSLSHIKSHQDKKKPFEELPLQAQLNCRADWLAEAYLQENPEVDHSRAPVLPSSGCQLHLASGTATHNIKKALKHARTVPPLIAKLCHINGWSREEFDDIDWESHGTALKRLKRHRKTLVQYLNDYIPVGKRVNEYHKKYPACCPSCPEPVEDREHLWECQAPSRQRWRRECYSTMLKTLTDLDTAPPLQELLLDALSVLMGGRSMATIRSDPAVADVARAQRDIGWHQILKGRFSQQWTRTQDRYLGAKATRTVNGGTWMTKVIEVWLSQWLKLWKLRNEDRHGRDVTTRAQAEEAQVYRELQQFYEAHDGNVPERLQWIFDTPISTRMEGKVGITRLWLNTWKPVMEQSYTTALETG
jgi:hypothetical protein